MSTQIRFGRPVASASATPPIAPPTGPDSSVCRGRWRADAAVSTPPEDCITCSGHFEALIDEAVLERNGTSHRNLGAVRGEHPIRNAPCAVHCLRCQRRNRASRNGSAAAGTARR